MERSKHVSINIPALRKLSNIVFILFVFNIKNSIKSFLKISCAMMDGQCSTDDWIGSDVGPPKGNIQLTIDWFVFK
jgi:hypothetical protein